MLCRPDAGPPSVRPDGHGPGTVGVVLSTSHNLIETDWGTALGSWLGGRAVDAWGRSSLGTP